MQKPVISLDAFNLGYDYEKMMILEELARLKKENDKLRSDLNALKAISTNHNESEKKFEQLFNNISDAVYYLKIDDHGVAGKFVEVNEHAYRRLGYTRHEMMNMSPFDIDIHGREEVIQLLKKIKNNESWTFETAHICKDGSQIPVEIKTNVLDIEGEIYTLSVCRDITERKRAADLRIQAEKMNIVAQLAAGIAHEIRNPLTSLMGFLQLFRSNTVPSKEILDAMESELERINAISGEFLTLAKPSHLDFSPIDLQELLKNVVDILTNEALGQSVSIQTKSPKENIIIHGAGRELKKLFLNLIKNAIEAMPNGGEITITAENGGGYADIRIQDNVIGMTEEQVKHLGEPFFTTKETGTGLGLVVTFNIIRTHHGEISVTSKWNEGTTFTVRLPVTQESY
jgi:two-component system, sporulation sensor kinase A